MYGAFFVQVVTNSFKYSSSWNPQGIFQLERPPWKGIMLVTWDVSIRFLLKEAQPRGNVSQEKMGTAKFIAILGTKWTIYSIGFWGFLILRRTQK